MAAKTITIPDFTDNQVRALKLALGGSALFFYYRLNRNRQKMEFEIMKANLIKTSTMEPFQGSR